MTRFYIHPTAFLLPAIPFFGILTWWQTLLLWSSAALHETGHLLALRICRCPVESITLLPFGLCAIPAENRTISPKDEIFCAASGPAVNLLLSALLLALPLSPQWEAARYALYCNLALFAVNTLPILPLDGGRVLFFSILLRKDPAVSESVCKTVAIILLALLLIPAAFSFWNDRNPSFPLIWTYLTWNTWIRRGSI